MLLNAGKGGRDEEIRTGCVSDVVGDDILECDDRPGAGVGNGPGDGDE